MSCSQEKLQSSLTIAGVPPSLWEVPTENLTEEMRLRGSIARALVTDPIILILDEPLKKIDTSSMLEILLLLKKLNKKGITIKKFGYEAGGPENYINMLEDQMK